MSEKVNNIVLNNKDDQAQEISIVQLLFAMWRNKFLIIALAAVGLVVGLILGSSSTYEATASVLVNPSSLVASSYESVYTNSLYTNVSTQKELISSTSNLQRALDSLDMSSYIDAEGKSYAEKDWSNVDYEKLATIETSSYVITVTVKDNNASYCVDLANAIVNCYIDYLTEYVKSTESSQRVYLESRIPEVEQELKSSSAILASYKKANNITEVNDELLASNSELQDLQRTVETDQSLLLSLQEKLEETKMLEAATEGDVVVLDIAQAKRESGKIKALAIGFLAGGVVGALIVFLMFFTDSSIKTEEDVKQVIKTPIPMLGWTYYLKNVKDVQKEFPGLVVYNSPKSAFAEKFNTIANNITYSLEDKVQVVSINSTEANNGKTTVLCNIATSYAMAGKKVLLMDADFRNAEVSSFFHLTSDSGLVDVVNGKKPLEKCLVKPVKDLANLDVLPAGNCPENVNALFNSAQFSDFMKKLRESYDYILVDVPALSTGSEFTNLAKDLDGFILNLRVGVSTKNALYNFAQSAGFLQVPVLGYVLSGVIPSNHAANEIGSFDFSNGAGKKVVDSVYAMGTGFYRFNFKKEKKASKN